MARVRNTGWRDIQDKKTTSNPTSKVLQWNPNQAAPPFKAKPQFKIGGNFRTPLDYGGSSALLMGGW